MNKIDITLLHYLYFNSSKQTVLNYLNQCKCCIRHQDNKPYIYNNIEFVTKNKKRKKYECFCDCKCRHYARDICKNIELTFYLEDFFSLIVIIPHQNILNHINIEQH